MRVNLIYPLLLFVLSFYLILFNETGSSSDCTVLTVMVAEFGWKPSCSNSGIILAFAPE
jgi:hypothetical protein